MVEAAGSGGMDVGFGAKEVAPIIEDAAVFPLLNSQSSPS